MYKGKGSLPSDFDHSVPVLIDTDKDTHEVDHHEE